MSLSPSQSTLLARLKNGEDVRTYKLRQLHSALALQRRGLVALEATTQRLVLVSPPERRSAPTVGGGA